MTPADDDSVETLLERLEAYCEAQRHDPGRSAVVANLEDWLLEHDERIGNIASLLGVIQAQRARVEALRSELLADRRATGAGDA